MRTKAPVRAPLAEMVRSSRRFVSPTMAVALVALMVALAGTAGAEPIARVSALITGKQVKNKSLTGRDFKNESLSGRQIRGLTRRDLKASEVEALRGRSGAPGATGVTGAQGIRGEPGVDGISGYRLATATTNASVPTGSTAIRTVTCPGGETAVGGGFDLHSFTPTTDHPFFSVLRDGPVGSSRGKWAVFVRNNDVAARNLGIQVHAVCVTALP